MADVLGKLRWFRLTPDHCLGTLLVIEGLLWLSNRLGWPPWHKGYAVLTAVAMVAGTMLLMAVWFGAAGIFRWRFQFGIRSLLVLTVAVAVPCSWLSWEMTKAREQKEAADAARKVRLQIGYEHQYDAKGYPTAASRNGPTWVRDWFGDDFLSDVIGVNVPFAATGDFGEFFPTYGCVATDQDLLPLKTFPRLRFLNLAGTRVTDEGMAYVGELRELHGLSLWRTNVGDKGIAHLRGLLNLRDLDISETKVTNSGLAHLKDLPHLEAIRLDQTAVDDDGLPLLAKCRRLKKVSLDWRFRSDQLTRAGVARFKRAMPNCNILYQPPFPDPRPWAGAR
jgi:hypothetical protein